MLFMDVHLTGAKPAKRREWRNEMILESYFGSFPHSLRFAPESHGRSGAVHSSLDHRARLRTRSARAVMQKWQRNTCKKYRKLWMISSASVPLDQEKHTSRACDACVWRNERRNCRRNLLTATCDHSRPCGNHPESVQKVPASGELRRIHIHLRAQLPSLSGRSTETHGF